MVSTGHRVKHTIVHQPAVQAYDTHPKTVEGAQPVQLRLKNRVTLRNIIYNTVVEQLQLRIQLVGFELSLPVILKSGKTSHHQQRVPHKTYKNLMVERQLTPRIHSHNRDV